MRMIGIFVACFCFVSGCESKPQEATEVPEDLMREIAMDAARDTIKIDGPAILMIEAKDQIQQQSRQTATETARQVAAEEIRKVFDPAQLQQMKARIEDLERQIQQLRASTATGSQTAEPSK